MKRLFIILAAAIMFGLTACERDGQISKDEYGRSSKYAWQYLAKDRNKVENDLKNAGWEQNYFGKTNSGNPVVLYVYNRPTDLSWKPVYFTKYAYDSQRTEMTSLSSLMKNSKMYGELYMIFRDEVVADFGIFWMLPTSNDVLEKYINFSDRTYQAYTADCGDDAQWKGKVNTINYSERQRFISAINNASEPNIYEYGSDYRSNTDCSFSIEARFNYFLNNTFHIAYEGEKY